MAACSSWILSPCLTTFSSCVVLHLLCGAAVVVLHSALPQLYLISMCPGAHKKARLLFRLAHTLTGTGASCQSTRSSLAAVAPAGSSRRLSFACSPCRRFLVRICQVGLLRLLLAHLVHAGELCREWAPESFVISFKLETEERLLVPKAAAALELYGVHLVVRSPRIVGTRAFTHLLARQVANELTTRMERVLLVSRGAERAILTAEIRLSAGPEPIESSIVERLVAAHQQHIASTP